MAWRGTQKLPRFRVHQRASGFEKRSIVSRGQKVNTSSANAIGNASPPDDNEADLHEHSYSPIEDQDSSHTDPSLHEIKQSANVEAWSKVRSTLLKAATESQSMPNEQQCALCQTQATYRCVECGPLVYFCSTCLGVAHSKTNLFHTPELWEVSCLLKSY